MIAGVAPGASGLPPGGDDSRLALGALVIANLSVLAGVLWLGWDAVAVLLLYWHENLIIGVYTLLRMLRAGGLRALPVAVFFVFHFGVFCLVHGTLLLHLVLKGGASGGGDGPFGALQGLLTDFYASAPPSFFWSLAALAVSHGVSTVQHALVRNEDAGRSANAIMSDPYGRIVVMHLVVMAGAVAVVQLGSPQLLVLALVALKVVLDVLLHVRAHRRRRAKQAQPPPTPSRSADVLAEEGVLLEDEAESRNTPPRRPRIRREQSGGA